MARSQPYRLDPPVNGENLPQIITNADEMFQILFEDVAALEDSIAASAATTTPTSTQSGSQLAFGFGNPAEGEQGPMGPPGLQGLQGPQGLPGVAGWPGRDGDDGAGWVFAIPSVQFAEASTLSASLTTPLLLGGLAATSALSLQTTSGVGASGADIVFKVGNNGATEALRIFNSGNVTSQGIFTSNFPAGGGFVIDNPTADAGVVGQSYMTFQTADVARWFLGMSASAGDGGFQLYNGIAGAPVWSVNKTTSLTSILAGLTVTGVITGTSLTVTNPVTVPNGGTGVTTLADAGVLIGNGAGVVQVTTAGTAGEVLTSNGAGVDPTFQAAAGGAGSQGIPGVPGRDGDDGDTWMYVATPAANAFTPVYATAYATANQAIANGVVTSIIFDTEVTDSGSVHSTSSNTDRFVIPTGGAGKYLIGCSVLCTSTVAVIGQYVIQPRVNGADIDGGTAVLFGPGNGSNMGLNQSTMVTLADADYVTFGLFNNSGNNENILGGASVTFYNPRGWIVRVA